MKAGCSSQICTAEEKAHGIITTCEYKPEYECYQKATCGCGEGRCVWEDEGEVNKCVKEKQAGTF